MEIEFWFEGISIGFYPKHSALFINWETICYIDAFKVDIRKAVKENSLVREPENENINTYNLNFLTKKTNELWG